MSFINLKTASYARKKLWITLLFEAIQKNKKDEKYIYLRITVEGIPKELSTKRLWPSSKWNPSAGRAIGNTEESRLLNAYLDTLYYKAMQAKKILLDQDKEVTAEAIKNTLLGVGEKKK